MWFDWFQVNSVTKRLSPAADPGLAKGETMASVECKPITSEPIAHRGADWDQGAYENAICPFSCKRGATS